MFLDPKKPAVILAPMEGVTDAPFREFITRAGYYDYCVSEFIRVSGHALNEKVFMRHIPELKTAALTSSRTPVQIQLLGGNEDRLAESAAAAIRAGATGIDLNFGCPAPTVNRHDGGATLLKYPERIERIIASVRNAVPSQYPVSAKMRLGFDDPNAIYENAKRAEHGGASWLTIHGRTKTQGYTPPAYWEPIGKVLKSVKMPVIANGEIHSLEEFKKCRETTGAIHFMIGRAALSNPGLAKEIRMELGLDVIPTPAPICFPKNNNDPKWFDLFSEYAKVQPSVNRLKQWARYLHTKNNLAGWDQMKSLTSTEEFLEFLKFGTKK